MDPIKGRYILGKMDGTGTGRRNCEAAFTYEIRGGSEFSMSGEVWNPRHTDHIQGGQCIEEVLTHFPDDARAQSMAAIWRRWHLNYLHAGCEHQRALGWGKGKDIALAATDLTPAQVETLQKLAMAKVERPRQGVFEAKRDKLLEGCTHDGAGPALHHAMREHFGGKYWAEDERAATYALKQHGKEGGRFINRRACGFLDAILERIARNHPAAPFKGAIYEDSLGAPCPECGYCYGAAWLKEELPAEVIETVKGWAGAVAPKQRISKAEAGRTLAQTLEALGVTMIPVAVNDNPNMADKDWPATHYRCTFEREGVEPFSVFFSLGAAHMSEPETEQVLDCILRDDPRGESFANWCGELGFDEDSRTAERTFQACTEQAADLVRFLGADVCEEIREAG